MKIIKITKSVRNKKKFALPKLIMVLLIIGILPVLALSESKKADVKNKQSEAKMILKQIYTMQKAYYAEKDKFWITNDYASSSSPTGFAFIRIEIPQSARYTYTLTSIDAGATMFFATATSGALDDDAQVDVWVIDQTGFLRVTSDDSEY